MPGVRDLRMRGWLVELDFLARAAVMIGLQRGVTRASEERTIADILVGT